MAGSQGCHDDVAATIIFIFNSVALVSLNFCLHCMYFVQEIIFLSTEILHFVLCYRFFPSLRFRESVTYGTRKLPHKTATQSL